MNIVRSLQDIFMRNDTEENTNNNEELITVTKPKENNMQSNKSKSGQLYAIIFLL